MKLTLKLGVMFVDNFFFCYAKPGNGNVALSPGRYSVQTQYSHAHGEDLPNVEHVGWVGAQSRNGVALDLVLGRVLNGQDLLPCAPTLGRLLALLEAAEDCGQAVTLEVIE